MFAVLSPATHRSVAEAKRKPREPVAPKPGAARPVRLGQSTGGY